MARAGLSIAIGTIGLALAGCASMPSFDAPDDEHNRPTVSTIVDEIQCEIAEARDAVENADTRQLRDFEPFRQWTAAVTLTLTVDDSIGTATGGLPISFINTLSKTATFAFNLNPTLYQLRTRTYTQNYTINISAIPSYSRCRELMRASNGFNLEGDLGLKDQIYMGLHPFKKSQHGADYYASATQTIDHPAAKTADTFGGTIFFNVFYGVSNVGPTWTLATFKGPTAGLGYVRNDLHQIVITFAPAPLPVATSAKPKPPPSPPVPPTPPQKPAILSSPRPVPPAARPLVEGPEMENYRKAEQAYEQADRAFSDAQTAYNQDLLNYSTQIISFSGQVRAYEAQVQKYNADLAAYSQSLASGTAGDAARNANQAAATVQAIQSLGQILNRP
jgi:hypothetical protein